MTAKRQYVLKERAERQAETRRRIVETTVALHQELGPAATQIAEIARRAGVQRATVYNHFADEESLFAACSAHWRLLHPMPDPASWSAIAIGSERLRLGLRELYVWYRETRSMTGNVLRDSQTVPSLRQVIGGGLLRNLERIADALSMSIEAPVARRESVRRAAHAATDFHFWQALSPLGDNVAAGLGAGLIELAAQH